MKKIMIIAVFAGVIGAFIGGIYIGVESSRQVKQVVQKMDELNHTIERSYTAVKKVEDILSKIKGFKRALESGYELRIQERQGTSPYPFQ